MVRAKSKAWAGKKKKKRVRSKWEYAVVVDNRAEEHGPDDGVNNFRRLVPFKTGRRVALLTRKKKGARVFVGRTRGDKKGGGEGGRGPNESSRVAQTSAAP